MQNKFETCLTQAEQASTLHSSSVAAGVRQSSCGDSIKAHEVVLDLREIAADQRRAVVFACFARLQPGQRLMLIHHHHSTLLHYLLLAEAPRAFSWEYLEQGPQLWRIRISKHALQNASAVH